MTNKMKYLKTYNESFNCKGISYKYEWAMPTSSIRKELDATLRDILLDAQDLGYGISTGWIEDPYVWIGKRRNFDLGISEVRDIIERVKNYLTSEGFEIIVNEVGGRNTIITQVYIYFNKKS